ncbi:related to PEX29-peroxisomal integral membrane peroxin [Sporisorium reilianum f. sp. reilianum]|uniref:Related to PEX29-peroxisomal integral membrane peroxin n=1 Tax=Sporisorium reilianum f. sp. reilianum TaxID=72559 RepID=A0A2N8UEP1_9BASI|nr:related to PEX29-peroxisomal integral membrane peroxin [Sporisorium reilianum f. sp. reilianum]
MDDVSASPKARASLFSNSLFPSSSPSPSGRRLSSSSSSQFGSPSTETSASKSGGGLFQQTSMALRNFALESVLAASAAPPRLPVAKNKEPLSLPTTTKNFRGFVQKSGPMFWFQDGVEATLLWQDTSWTLMWMAIWAVISIYPWLLLLAPSTILSVVLVMTHRARYQDTMTPNIVRMEVPKSPASKSRAADDKSAASSTASPAEVLAYSTTFPTSTGEGVVQPPLVPNPPHEGTVKYYENLRDIQNMMRMIIDGYDLLAPTVPYLNWSSYSRSLHILQLSLLTTVLLFFVAPYVPYRAVMLLAGEGAFILNHPWAKPALQGLVKRIDTSREGRKLVKVAKEGGHKLREWIEQDRLDDFVWERGWRNVEMFENERFQPTKRAASSSGLVGGWSAHNLRMGERLPWTKGPDGWSSDQLEVLPGHQIDISRQVAMTLEPGWEWVPGDDWRIDWGGTWSAVGVDDLGYVYTDASWQKPASYAYGHGGGVPDYPPSIFDVQAQDDETAEQADEPDSDVRSTLPPLSAGVVDHDPKMKAETRRRRWLRRAVRTA